jgi:hypothetical protein
VPPPDAAGRYRLPGVRLLVALCHELQREAGDGPFYLGCRDVGRLLGVPFQRAAKWLRRLVQDGVIERTNDDDERLSRRAREYRWVGGEGRAS